MVYYYHTYRMDGLSNHIIIDTLGIHAVPLVGLLFKLNIKITVPINMGDSI